MEKEITIENLQQEVARLTAEVEKAKTESKEKEQSKDYWYRESERWEKKYRQLADQVRALATMTSGLVTAA